VGRTDTDSNTHPPTVTQSPSLTHSHPQSLTPLLIVGVAGWVDCGWVGCGLAEREMSDLFSTLDFWSFSAFGAFPLLELCRFWSFADFGASLILELWSVVCISLYNQLAFSLLASRCVGLRRCDCCDVAIRCCVALRCVALLACRRRRRRGAGTDNSHGPAL